MVHGEKVRFVLGKLSGTGKIVGTSGFLEKSYIVEMDEPDKDYGYPCVVVSEKSIEKLPFKKEFVAYPVSYPVSYPTDFTDFEHSLEKKIYCRVYEKLMEGKRYKITIEEIV